MPRYPYGIPAVPGRPLVGGVAEVTAELAALAGGVSAAGFAAARAKTMPSAPASCRTVGVEAQVQALGGGQVSPDTRCATASAALVVRRSAPAAVPGVPAQFGTGTPVASTGPAVRHAPSAPPLPAGRYHCPAARWSCSRTSRSPGAAARAVVGGPPRPPSRRPSQSHFQPLSLGAWREVRVR